MKTIKNFFAAALFIAATTVTMATVQLTGYVSDNGNPANGIAVTVDWGGGIVNTVTTVNGYYTDTSLSNTGVGTINVSILDCNGNLVSVTKVYTPNDTFNNSMINIPDLIYCNSTPCSAGFSLAQQFDSTNMTYTNVIELTDLSVGTGLTYTWNFGDGTSYTGVNFTHTYSTYGTYVLCLTVDDGNGCVDTYCDTLAIDSTGTLIGKMSQEIILVMGNGENSTATASLISNELDFNVTVFPNPATENVNVTINSTLLNQNVSVQIIDLSGKVMLNESVVLTEGEQYVNLDVSTLDSGIYIVKVNELSTKLIIK